MSRLFAPFRSLGYISTGIAPVVHVHSTKDAAVKGTGTDGGRESDGGIIVTSVGKAWAMWTIDRMQLLLVGPTTAEPISSLAVHSSGDVLAAAGSHVYISRRAQLIGTLSTPTDGLLNGKSKSNGKTRATDESSEESEEDDSEMEVDTTALEGPRIAHVVAFGDQVVGLAASGDCMWVWDFGKREHHTTISFPSSFGRASALIHPATYINKVVVGSDNGSLGIFNVRTGALVHIFPPTLLSSAPSTSLSSLFASSSTQKDQAGITNFAQSPAVDVLAVGLSDGRCALVDVKLGEELISVKMGGSAFGAGDDFEDAITGIAFRADSQGQILATASASGALAFWNLDDACRLIHVVQDAHDAAVAGVHFLPGRAVLLTSSADNSLKQWFFEAPLSPPRLLSSRAGNQAPPALIRYYREDGKTIISAGNDRTMRAISVVRDSRTYELSQGAGATKKASRAGVSLKELRLPPIQRDANGSSAGAMSFSTARASEWDGLLSAHQGSRLARTWSVEQRRMGKTAFDIETVQNNRMKERKEGDKVSMMIAREAAVDDDEGKPAVSGRDARRVCVTACGNYGLVGYAGGTAEGGRVKMWNMQSGILRREFVLPKVKGADTKREREIVGIATDPLNTVVIVATRGGRLLFFDFASAKLQHTVTLASGSTTVLLQRSSALLAVAGEDATVRLVDIETRVLVRQMAVNSTVLDMDLTPDSRWLITTSADSVIRTFDIPTGTLIDAFRTDAVATSLTFSPTGDFLATAHVDTVGVALWANRAQFIDVSLAMTSARNVEEAAREAVPMPVMEGVDDEGAGAVEKMLRPEAWVDGVLEEPEKKVQLGKGLVTLSAVPRSRWQTLLNLETIKARNKPREPPKAPERAPFFIPTIPGTEPRFDLGQRAGEEATPDIKKRKLHLGPDADVGSEFTRLLDSEPPSSEYPLFFAHVASLPPAALDLEIRTLSPTPGRLSSLLDALARRLASGRDFELCQALLALVLRIHPEPLIDGGQEVRRAMKGCLEVQEQTGKRIRDLVDYGIGVRAFVAGQTGVL